MEVVLALLAAGTYGMADYCGGRAARSISAIAVTLVGQFAALIVLGAIAILSGVPVPPLNDWVWGGVAGILGSTGLLMFYRAMGSGFMTVVAPISAVVTAAIPVIVGLVSGERPSGQALIAMPLAIVAIALVSDVLGPHHRRAPRSIILMAVVAGIGFGFIFVVLHHVSSTSGIWPVVAMRTVSVPYMFIVTRLTKTSIRQAMPHKWLVFASGIMDSGANALYALAVRMGLMSVVAVIIALYPASTLMLATGLDKERIHRPQAVGLVMAAVALVLITLG